MVQPLSSVFYQGCNSKNKILNSIIKIPGNQKHLTLNDRLYIEKAINEGRTFKDIPKNLCKNPTNISKEVKAHRLSAWQDHGLFVNIKISVSIAIMAEIPTYAAKSSFAK